MISDDTLMGTDLMTFLVQESGWFGRGFLLQCNKNVQDILSHKLFLGIITSLCLSVEVRDNVGIK